MHGKNVSGVSNSPTLDTKQEIHESLCSTSVKLYIIHLIKFRVKESEKNSFEIHVLYVILRRYFFRIIITFLI